MGNPQLVSVRTATLQDVAPLVQLWQGIMEDRAAMDVRVQLTDDASQHWAASLTQWLEQDHGQVLVAEKHDKIIGYIVAVIQQRPLYYYQQQIGYIVDLGVDGHAHQGGVGTALLKGITPWFKSQDVDLVEATVSHLHPMAQAFWRANGAAEVMTTFWYRLK